MALENQSVLPNKDKFQPLVSIVIPVYNGSNYLAEAIDSALAQTYENVEILVVNDGSSDGGKTRDVALSYGDRIRYFEKENGGVSTALNLGVRVMRGDYFSWLSHDDLYAPGKLQLQIAALGALSSHERDCCIMYSDYSFFSHGGNRSNRSVIQLSSQLCESFRFWLTLTSSLHGCTLLIPRRAFTECGLFHAIQRYSQDYDLWFRFAGLYKFVHSPEELVYSRVHPTQDSAIYARESHAECSATLMVFLESLTTEELSANGSRTVTRGYGLLGASFIRRGYVGPAKKAFSLAFRKPASKMEKIAIIIYFSKLLLVQYLLIRLRSLVSTKLRRILRSF